MRIVVGRSGVRAVAPVGTGVGLIEGFVREKRDWIVRKLSELENRRPPAPGPWPERLVNGAQVLYRGRRVELTLQMDGDRPVRVDFQDGFVVTVPVKMPRRERERKIRQALQTWMDRRLVRDIERMVLRHIGSLREKPQGIRVKSQRSRWGSCGTRGMLHFNRALAFVPDNVIEYVVVHELCHLKERNHSPSFWRLVEQRLPDYEQSRRWLRTHENALLGGHR
jgi:hypothetical protein